MRNRALHDALRDFALEAAALLTRDVRNGAEVPFELDEQRGRGPILYSYRALTSEFIAARWPSLRMLPSCPPAAGALGAGAAAYLRVRGEPGDDSEPALRAMLERLYEDTTDFAFPEERFERVYDEVERTLFEHTQRATVVAPLFGAVLESARVELGDGLALVRPSEVPAPLEALGVGAAAAPPGAGGRVDALCVLERDIHVDAAIPVAEAQARFRRLLTALRLFNGGGVALAGLAWYRADEGRWRPVALAPSGVARGEPWLLRAAEEVELADFLPVVEASRHAGPIAWALRRFEMGVERPCDSEALSDHLLALRALLEGLADAGHASLGLRVAALCAEEGERRMVQRRVELAFGLERLAIAGTGLDDEGLDSGPEPPRVLSLEMEAHLRALLRDVLWGYLGPDLKAAADDILLRSAEPIEVQARDLRRRVVPVEEEAPEPTVLVAPEPAIAWAPEPEPEPAAERWEAPPEDTPVRPLPEPPVIRQVPAPQAPPPTIRYGDDPEPRPLPPRGARPSAPGPSAG